VLLSGGVSVALTICASRSAHDHRLAAPPWGIMQPGKALGDEAVAPQAGGVDIAAQLRGDLVVGLAFAGQQHDPGSAHLPHLGGRRGDDPAQRGTAGRIQQHGHRGAHRFHLLRPIIPDQLTGRKTEHLF